MESFRATDYAPVHIMRGNTPDKILIHHNHAIDSRVRRIHVVHPVGPISHKQVPNLLGMKVVPNRNLNSFHASPFG